MSLLFDQRYRWHNASHDGLRSECRIRIFSSNGLGPVVILTESSENNGPPIVQVIECIITLLDGSQEIRNIPGYDGFDSAMWYLGSRTNTGPRFFRIREIEGGGFDVDLGDHIPGLAMDQLLGMQASTDLVWTKPT